MNILLTSAGRRTYLVNYFKDALKSYGGKVFASNSVDTYSLKQADGYTITPPIYSDGYINHLIEFCLSNNIKAVISLFDIDLPVLSKNISTFKKYGIEVIVSNESVIDICNDKWKTYQFLLANNINTPTTYLSLNSLYSDMENIKFPLIVKPRWGMGSIGVYKADNIDELNVFYKKVVNEIKSTYLKHESASNIEQSVIMQQYISGAEYGIEVINDLQKKYITTMCKKKISMRSGETDLAITLKEPRLETIGKQLSHKLGHIGLLDTDCLEQNGVFYILEMNARFGGQYPFSHLAGANLPLQIIEWLLGNKTEKKNISIKYNVLSSKDIQPVIVENGN